LGVTVPPGDSDGGGVPADGAPAGLPSPPVGGRGAFRLQPDPAKPDPTTPAISRMTTAILTNAI
jgi:hypothetical protein